MRCETQCDRSVLGKDLTNREVAAFPVAALFGSAVMSDAVRNTRQSAHPPAALNLWVHVLARTPLTHDGFKSNQHHQLRHCEPPGRRIRATRWLLAMTRLRQMFAVRHSGDLPDGQKKRRMRKAVHPFAQKYSASRLTQIKLTVSLVPTHKRGVSRSSRTLGAGCDGRGTSSDE